MITVAALYVDPCGVYADIPGVEPWGLPDRDAREYRGPHPTVCHPPCASWGRYAKPHPGSTARGPLLGDDGGCFGHALDAVRRFGGVLEHPRDSKAWARYGLTKPGPVGWSCLGFQRTVAGDTGTWVCEVDQGHYGHAARKPTWLYYVGPTPPTSCGARPPRRPSAPGPGAATSKACRRSSAPRPRGPSPTS